MILVLCNIAGLDVFRFILFAAGHVKIYIGFLHQQHFSGENELASKI